jgi:hypothetical protein
MDGRLLPSSRLTRVESGGQQRVVPISRVTCALVDPLLQVSCPPIFARNQHVVARLVGIQLP